MALNSRMTNNKFGSIEKMLNRYLIFFVIVLVMEMIISTILTMEKGVEYINTDQPFNESTAIERLKFLGNYNKMLFLHNHSDVLTQYDIEKNYIIKCNYC